jgi:hypothetical protein
MLVVNAGRRGTRLVAAVLAAAALTAGCATGGAAPAPAPPPSPLPAPASVAPTTTIPAPAPSRAQEAVDATASAGQERDGVTLGVAVLDRTTGRTAANDDADTPLRAASVAKLFTIVDILSRREAGQVTTSAGDEQRFRRALSLSDDEAMNALWSTYGGPAGIRRVAELLGLGATSPPADTSQWGEVRTSARDVAALYGYVTTRLTPADRDFMLQALEAAPATAADGFDQGFGLLDPDRRGTAAAKQGWLCCIGSSVDLHSAGFPDENSRYVVVLLSNQPRGYDAARSVLDDAASAARDALAG